MRILLFTFMICGFAFSPVFAKSDEPKKATPAKVKESPVKTTEGSAKVEDEEEVTTEEESETPNKEIVTKTKEYSEKEAIEIVSKAEQIRAVDNAELEVNLRTIASKQDSYYLMNVQRGVGKRALVDFLEPAEEYGRRLLVIKDKYWAKFPDSKKIHPISRREMLGNSVFGIIDLFQLDVVKEYKARIEGEVKIGDKDCFKAVLHAKHEEVVYRKVEYYIAKKDFFPVKARFYAESGRLLKTLYLTGRRKFGGQFRPNKFTMVDNVTKGRKSYWRTVSLRLVEIPAHVFRRSNLKKKN